MFVPVEAYDLITSPSADGSAQSRRDSAAIGCGSVEGRLSRALAALDDAKKQRDADQCSIRHLERQLHVEQNKSKSYKARAVQCSRLQRQVEQLRTSLDAAEAMIRQLRRK